MRQAICPNCKQPHPAGAAFCARCGHRLSPSDAPSAGGRRQALILGAAGFLLFLVAVGGAFLLTVFFIQRMSAPEPAAPENGESAAVIASQTRPGATVTSTPSPAPSPSSTPSPFASPTASTETPSPTPSPTGTPVSPAGPETIVLGYSVENAPIEAVRFGNGPRPIVFVGGLHAGFAPSSVSLAQRTVDHFREAPETVPEGATLYVILSMNPDSAYSPGNLPGRLNANGVDLNRNWNCRWSPDPEIEGRTRAGAGGPRPLSEPETQAVAEFLLDVQPAAVVFWEARASGGLVSPGGCGESSDLSQPLAERYALAAGYRWERFESYTGQMVQGDASNWLDGQGIPAVAVLLPSATAADWDANRAAIEALLRTYGE